jgi:regulator of protease activity HflC (stomatin/prohibitin superfamily)
MRKGQVVLTTIAVIGGFFLLATLLGVQTVDSGEVAVVTQFGRVTGRVLEPGAHIITPFIEGTLYYNTKKVTYETATEEKQKNSNADYKDFTVDTNTEDGQPVDVAYTIRFSVDPTKASWIAQNIGNQTALVEKIVKTESRIWARNIPRRFSAENLYTGEGSQKVQEDIFSQLEETFKVNGLILDSVGLREIVFDGAYTGAIKQKQVEAVKVETEKNIAAQEMYRKEARITAAEASAKEQSLQRETISDQLLRKLWIEKWNGTLPSYMTGGDASLLLQLPK